MMMIMKSCPALCACLLLSAGLASAQTGPATVSSPDGAIQATFSTVAGPAAQPTGGQLVYEVTYRGKPMIERSNLGLDLLGQPVLGAAVRIEAVRSSKIDETYEVPAGKSKSIRNVCNAVAIDLRETAGLSRQFTVEARAYDDGVAFRYVVPRQDALTDLLIVNEKTQFVIAKDATTYPLILRNFRTSWEDNYQILPLSAIHPESLIALPLLTELPGVGFLAITEAHIENYSGMYLTHSGRDAKALEARLSPHIDDPNLSVAVATPAPSPWRVLMIASAPGRLIESHIVDNLNPPSAIADTSWIKPGKAAWDWWSGPYDENVNFRPGKNTATAKHYVDFASQAGFEYFMLDGGWARPVAPGPYDSGSDLSQANPNIDMPELLSYAQSKNVKIWLWAHWTDMNRQIDQVFPLYEKWGIAGVKIDFMDRDDQQMVDFYRSVAKKAADHHLMVDFHGAFKPDGISRTYPNLLTREGVLGLEYNKWSARVTPDHNVMLAFTRMLAGPMDYTPGGFHNSTAADFVPRNDQPMVMGTRAHQTALFVVFDSPLMMVSDYPEAYQGQKELAFLSAVPASWDETRVLNAKVGDYITIARRHGREWYVGSIAGSHGAQVEISLEFLPSGNFIAEVYSDAPDAASNPTHTVLEQRNVNRSMSLKTTMVTGGGQAIRIRPGS
jgi:alpha-glucosidase